MRVEEFDRLPLHKKVNCLYVDGDFIVSIRYYGYKVNLYQLGSVLFEVFYNHKHDRIDKIVPYDGKSSRVKFYTDQIKLPAELFS